MSYFPDRPLFKALGVSLGLHLVFFLSPAAFRPLALDLPSAPLRVVIGHAEKKNGAWPATIAAAKTPLVSEPPVLPRPAARQKPRSTPGGGTAAGAAFPSGTLGAAGEAGTAQVPREGVSADAMRQYRMALASAARRFKPEPRREGEHGRERTVEVALNVSSRWAMPEVVLLRSSGHERLDAQALAMVSQAARVTPVPEGLDGHDFRVLLPVRFSLENAP